MRENEVVVHVAYGCPEDQARDWLGDSKQSYPGVPPEWYAHVLENPHMGYVEIWAEKLPDGYTPWSMVIKKDGVYSLYKEENGEWVYKGDSVD